MTTTSDHVAETEYEYAAQLIEGGEWLSVKWGPSDASGNVVWVTETEAKNRAAYWRSCGDVVRLVRRPVTHVEVVEDE